MEHPRDPRLVWNPNTHRWVEGGFDYPAPEFEQGQRRRGRGLMVLLGLLLFIVVPVVALTVVGEGDSTPSQGVGRSGVTPPSSPSPAPTYAQWPVLSPPDQITVRVRWAQAPQEYRDTWCSFFAAVPRDAVAQGVREGMPRAQAKALVRFVLEELC